MNVERLIANLLDRADSYDMQARDSRDTIDSRIAYALADHCRVTAELMQDALENDRASG